MYLGILDSYILLIACVSVKLRKGCLCIFCLHFSETTDFFLRANRLDKSDIRLNVKNSLKCNVLGVKHIHITLLTWQRPKFIWVLFGFCKFSQDAVREYSAWRTPAFKKNICFSEISFLFPYSPLMLVHKWEIHCHSGLPQLNHKFYDWHLCKMLIDKFLSYLSTLSSPHRHHSATISHRASKHSYFLSNHSSVHGSNLNK